MDREHRVRIRPPRDFGIRIGADVEEAQLLLWKKTLTEIDPQRFENDIVSDFVHQDKLVRFRFISHFCWFQGFVGDGFAIDLSQFCKETRDLDFGCRCIDESGVLWLGCERLFLVGSSRGKLCRSVDASTFQKTHPLPYTQRPTQTSRQNRSRHQSLYSKNKRNP